MIARRLVVASLVCCAAGVACARSPSQAIPLADAALPLADAATQESAPDASPALELELQIDAPAAGPFGIETFSPPVAVAPSTLPEGAASAITHARFRVRRCHHDALLLDAKAQGTVVVRLKIGEGGEVLTTEARSSTASAPLTTCLLGALQKVLFAPPKDGLATVEVRIALAPKPPGG